MVPSNHFNFQYCDSNIELFSIAPCKVITLNLLCILFCVIVLLLFWCLFLTLNAIAKRLQLLFANDFKSDNYCYRNSWKSVDYMGSNTETNLQNSYKNWSKEIKSDNFWYRKVGRAITKWGAIEKRITTIISNFDGSKNIFADCMFPSFYLLIAATIMNQILNSEIFKIWLLYHSFLIWIKNKDKSCP